VDAEDMDVTNAVTSEVAAPNEDAGKASATETGADEANLITENTASKVPLPASECSGTHLPPSGTSCATVSFEVPSQPFERTRNDLQRRTCSLLFNQDRESKRKLQLIISSL
jgi:hypothetical protein